MKYLNRNKLRDAINLALCVSATGLLGTGAAFAQTTAAAPATDTDSKTLETIVVTGSNIRRVETETASPVVSISRADIAKTGALTIGQVLQQLPHVAGAATNPQVNNGGGSGAATVSLRGLGSQRTLILINGRRSFNPDINAIPASAVERIEVLTDGASATYGSDAIGGVVNFIMRKDYEGAEASVSYGITDRSDGKNKGFSLMFGHGNDKGNITAGIDYNEFDAVSSGSRDFSKYATYLYSGSVFNGGSSRTPNGRINLPSGNPVRVALGCSSVTRIAGASGLSTSDYRCYDGSIDAFNYQAVNVILTPQERTNAFLLGNYQLTDNINAFMEVYHNKTSANSAIAPLPFDARADKVVISKDSYYNPFGENFGADGNNTYNQLRSRFTSLGQRRQFNGTATDQAVFGLDGNFGETWKWKGLYDYGHQSATTNSQGYVFYGGLQAALGPSMDDGTGNIVCVGTAGDLSTIIPGCTPLNIFNIQDPQTVATLQQYAVTPVYQSLNTYRSIEVGADGELFDLPAGAMRLAIGADSRKEYVNYRVDYVALANNEGNCLISSEACSSPLQGGSSYKELFFETYIPILADMPFAKLLSLSFGSRYSDYSSFGTTTNSKVALEWRPFQDLLVRGTVAEVFRAPNGGELYAGAAGDAPQFSDACIGFGLDPDGAGPLTPDLTHAAACGAPTGATAIDPTTGITSSGLSQTNGVASGSIAAGFDLQPESGKSFDFGLVYDPSWAPGLSVSADYWRIYLNDTITGVDAQTVNDACFHDPNSSFCSLIHRTPDGQVDFIREPTANLGRTDTDGVDLGVHYRMPDTDWGKFVFGLDTTYLNQWVNNQNPLALPLTDCQNPAWPDEPLSACDTVIHVDGHYNKSYGSYPHWRALANIGWSMGNWSVNWRTSYVGRLSVGDTVDGYSADACSVDVSNPACAAPTELKFGSYALSFISAGYDMPWHSHVDVGVDNVFDKQPPFYYQNNVLNANTDVRTFDTLGRRYWLRYTVKF